MQKEKPDTIRPDDEEIRIALIASAVVDELVRRYEVSPQSVLDATKWVQEHRVFISKLQHSSYLTLIGTLIGASLLVAWEGVKAYFRKSLNDS